MASHSCFKRIGVYSKARPYSTNPVYLIKVLVPCNICKPHDTHTKHYKSLWSLYRHFNIQHPHENPDFIINQARILSKQAQNGGEKA